MYTLNKELNAIQVLVIDSQDKSKRVFMEIAIKLYTRSLLIGALIKKG